MTMDRTTSKQGDNRAIVEGGGERSAPISDDPIYQWYQRREREERERRQREREGAK